MKPPSRLTQKSQLKTMAEIAEKEFGECGKCDRTGIKRWSSTFKMYEPCECILKAAAIFTLEKETIN